MINRTICIKNYQDFASTGDTWGILTGITDSGETVYYTGQTESDAYIAKIPVLLTQFIDDIGHYTSIIDDWKAKTSYAAGNFVLYEDNSYVCKTTHTSGVSFDISKWDITPNYSTGGTMTSTGNTITFLGESKIQMFRRYGKNDSDLDLYNPDWNSGYTYTFSTPDGFTHQLTGEKEKNNPFNYQRLYEYEIWEKNHPNNKIKYSDISDSNSNITFTSSGLTPDNSVEGPKTKLDYLMGVIQPPKIEIDVFIDRGDNTFFERHLKLSEIKSYKNLENYGNGYYKIKEY
jgi:hypothetical protein